MDHPGSNIQRLLAICHDELQARTCFNQIISSNLGKRYVVLERVITNAIGIITARIVIDKAWTDNTWGEP